MAEDFTPEEMQLLRALVVEVREVKELFGAPASKIDAKSSASADIMSSIKKLFDEEYETACAILARCDRIDSLLDSTHQYLDRIEGHLDAIEGHQIFQ